VWSHFHGIKIEEGGGGGKGDGDGRQRLMCGVCAGGRSKSETYRDPGPPRSIAAVTVPSPGLH
jgi:hypothetical protein